MNWSLYKYLALVALGGLAVLAFVWRQYPNLSKASSKPKAPELVSLLLILAVGLVAIYWNQYTETVSFSYLDLGSDTRDQYVPYYLYLIDHIRTGTLSTWVFDYGLGTSILNCQSWTFDPFNLVLVPLALVLGTAHFSLALVLTQTVKVLITAFCFDRLLCRFCSLPISRILGTTLYALGGYSIVWGQHYWLGSVLPIATIAVLAFEALAERRTIPRQLSVVLVTFASMAWSVYVGFMLLLFIAIYMFLRILSQDEQPTVKAVASKVGRLAAPVVCGCLLSCITVIPYAYFLFEESSRISADNSSALTRAGAALTTFVPWRWIPIALSRLLGTGLIDTGVEVVPSSLIPAAGGLDLGGSFTYEYLMLGFSVLIVILLLQFYSYIFSEGTRRTKRLVIAATVLIVLYCTNLFLPTLFNALVNLRYRSSFAIAIPICIAAPIGWERRVATGKPSRAGLVAGFVATGAILLWSLKSTLNGRLVCAFFILALLLSGAAFALFRKESSRPALVMTLLALAFATSVADGFFTTNLRIINPIDTFPLSEATRSTALGTASDDTLKAVEWIRSADPSASRLDNTYGVWTPHCDGLVADYSSVNCYNSTLDSDIEEFYDKLWPEVLPDGRHDVQWLDLSYAGTSQMLSLLGVRCVLAMAPVSEDFLNLVRTEGSVLVYEVTPKPAILSLYTSCVSETEADALPDATARRSAATSALIVPDGEVKTGDSGEGAPSNAGAQDLTMDESKAQLTGTVSSDADAYACLAIPHTSGWSVTIDGQPVETFRADYGFIGFKVPAGQHEVAATYVPTGSTVGIACAIAGALATIAMIAASRLIPNRG